MVRHQHTTTTTTTTTTVTPTKKKKGRPSLLDLKHRQHQQPNSPNSENPNIVNSDSLPRTSRSSRRSIPAHFLLGSDSESDLDIPIHPPPTRTRIRSRSDSDDDDDDVDERPSRKVRRTNAIPQEEKPLKATDAHITHTHNEATRRVVGGPTSTSTSQGATTSTSTVTSLPDKKLLLLVLDKLQKKDTRGVFAEPVDPEELPDYFEVIENPMDFGTVRKKLDGGVYKILEQIEDDVNLICSNAMEYNSPSTIFFRQARSIQELAKKEFEALRQEIRLTEPPPKPRRGRPPGSKNMKKFVESAPTDRGVSESPSDATPASRDDDASRSGSYNLRRGPSTYRFPRNLDNLFDFPASVFKSMPTKYGKKPCGSDEHRRETYSPSSQLKYDYDSSAAFGDSERQLIPVGLANDHSYARSLARFAANLGPVVWRIVSKKLRTVLPPGVDFGPGWVEEATTLAVQLSPLQETWVQPSCSSQDHYESEPLQPLASGFVNSTLANTPSASYREQPVEDRELSSHSEWSLLKGNNGDMRPGTSLQRQPGSFFHPQMNGFSFASGSQSEQGFTRQASSTFFNPSQLLNTHGIESSSLGASRNISMSRMQSPPVEFHGMMNTETDVGTSGIPYWQNLSLQERWDRPSLADLNAGLQASGSRSSSLQIGSPPQLDLVLQL